MRKSNSEYNFNTDPDLLTGSIWGQVREDEIRESRESNMIPEQFMVVVPLKDMGKTRGRVLRTGELCGVAKSTAEYIYLELKGETKS